LNNYFSKYTQGVIPEGIQQQTLNTIANITPWLCGESVYTIDILNYSPGVYFIIVQNEGSRIVRKVVVK
jgi:hypothetical protein